MDDRLAALQRLVVSLPRGVEAAPIAGDESTPFWLHVANTGDYLQRVGAFMVLIQTGLDVRVTVEGTDGNHPD